MAGKQVAKKAHGAELAKVDPEDEPSAEWGWHGEAPRTSRVAGWITVAVLLVLALFGNHHGKVENLWLYGIAAVIVVILLRDAARRRTSWRN